MPIPKKDELVPPQTQQSISSTIDEIKVFKTQLTNLLNKNFTDPTLIIGLNNLILSNFNKWVIHDLNSYYNSLEVELTNFQVDFDTIKFLDTLWLNFHYPIIKFFKLNHLNLLGDYKGKKPVVKPVEIRKMNDYLIKFIKLTFNFYQNLIKHFCTEYKNDLLPTKFLERFKYTLKSNAKDTSNPNFQANLLYLIHKCLLCMGDLLRHRSFIEITYVLPSLSIKNHYKFKDLNNSSKLLPYYNSSIEYYKTCITLLPALNEPYNHLGMIYNLANDKPLSVYWFLRSKFTRISSYKLGISNLNNLLSKEWLKEDLNNMVNFQKLKFSNPQLHTILIAIICYYYMPDIYQSGKHILPNVTIHKLEFIFLNLNFNDVLFKNQILSSVDLVENFYLYQMTILITFQGLLDSMAFERFINRYLEFFIKALLNYNKENEAKAFPTNSLALLRLVTNWLNCDSSIISKSNIGLLVQLLNTMIEDKSGEILLKPIRSYYFEEDLIFKDFKLIKYQFKDFNDDHLFKANNIDLLSNDYRSLIVNNVPIFLDNSTIQENKYDIDIKSEIEKHENRLRVLAILSFFYKIFESRVTLTDTFKVIEVEKAVKKKVKKINQNVRKETKIKRYSEAHFKDIEKSSELELDNNEDDNYEIEVEKEIGSDIDEIESFIRYHSVQLQSQIQDEVSGVESNGSDGGEFEAVEEGAKMASTSSVDESNMWKVEVNSTTVSQPNYSIENSANTQAPTIESTQWNDHTKPIVSNALPSLPVSYPYQAVGTAMMHPPPNGYPQYQPPLTSQSPANSMSPSPTPNGPQFTMPMQMPMNISATSVSSPYQMYPQYQPYMGSTPYYPTQFNQQPFNYFPVGNNPQQNQPGREQDQTGLLPFLQSSQPSNQQQFQESNQST